MAHSASPLEAIHEAEDFRISSDGTWYHGGRVIERQALVRLFSTVLMRDDTGHYWLKTPHEQCEVTVDDAPFVAISLEMPATANEPISFQTNMHEVIELDTPSKLHLRKNVRGEMMPYLTIRNEIEVALTRPVYYELMELVLREGRTQNGKRGITSAGVFFPLEA